MVETAHGSPEALEAWALSCFSLGHDGETECRAILADLYPRLRTHVHPDSVAYNDLIVDTVKTLKQIQLAITLNFWLHRITGGWNVTPRGNLWAWPGEKQLHHWARRGTGSAVLSEVEQAIDAYLSRPWLQHDAIDASAINALMVPKLAEVIFSVNSGAALGEPNWSYILSGGNQLAQMGLHWAGCVVGFVARWIVLPVLAAVLLLNGYEVLAAVAAISWGIYVTYRIVVLPKKWPAAKQHAELVEKINARLEAMLRAWQVARSKTINPQRLKEVVLSAEACGASYPSVLHVIIDRIISRDPIALTHAYRDLK